MSKYLSSLYAIVLLNLILTAVSCSPIGLDGQYINSADSFDTLSLLANGRYIRKFKTENRLEINKGTWGTGGNNKVFLRDWHTLNSTEPITFGLYIEKKIFDDNYRLMYDIDQNEYYQKLSQ